MSCQGTEKKSQKLKFCQNILAGVTPNNLVLLGIKELKNQSMIEEKKQKDPSYL